MKRKALGRVVEPAEERDPEAFDLNKWPFYWLTRAYLQYLSTLEDALRPFDIDIPRWRVLMLLSAGQARSISYLAHEAISKLPTMTRIIERMERDELVETRVSAADARVTEVLLTEKGRSARAMAWSQAARIYAEAFGAIPAQDIDRLNAMLEHIYQTLRR